MNTGRSRPYRVYVHLNKNELDKLNLTVQKSGLNRETFLRTLINGYIPREKPSQSFFEMVQQLRKIGNNINQLTMIAHRTNSIDIMKLKKELNYLNQSIGDIREQVLLPRKVED